MEQRQKEVNQVSTKAVVALVVVILVIAALLLVGFPFSPFREIGPWNHYVLDTFGEDFLSGL